MHSTGEIILLFLTILIAVTILVLISYYYYFILGKKHASKKTARSNSAECKKANKAIALRNDTDYLWANFEKIKAITVFFVLFTTFFGLLILISDTFVGEFIGIVGFIITVGFFIFFGFFIFNSYKAFEEKAKASLVAYEKKITDAIAKETSFEGDNIQSFSDDDDEFDTEAKTFSFPTEVTKIPFPPFEKNSKKHKIIATRKLEFLILSREYFSICKSAGKFDLLHPKQAKEAKKCVEVAGGPGECHEYYYSQMQNVHYDDKEECIRIIYNDDIEDVTFACKKDAPNRKPAMKALKEKLRLTERQKLQKIQEHKSYESIKKTRSTSTNTEENQEDKKED